MKKRSGDGRCFVWSVVFTSRHKQDETKNKLKKERKGNKTLSWSFTAFCHVHDKRREEEEREAEAAGIFTDRQWIQTCQSPRHTDARGNKTDRRQEEDEAFECSGEDGKYYNSDRDRKQEVKHRLTDWQTGWLTDWLTDCPLSTFQHMYWQRHEERQPIKTL